MAPTTPPRRPGKLLRTDAPPRRRRAHRTPAVLACLGVVLAVGAAGVTADAAYSGHHLQPARRLQSVGSTVIAGERLSGPDRYATAAAVSAASFSGGASI